MTSIKTEPRATKWERLTLVPLLFVFIAGLALLSAPLPDLTPPAPATNDGARDLAALSRAAGN